MNPVGDISDLEYKELVGKLRLIKMHAPGVLEELFGHGKSRDECVRTKGDVLKPMRTAEIDGPLLKAYLSVFSSKVASHDIVQSTHC